MQEGTAAKWLRHRSWWKKCQPLQKQLIFSCHAKTGNKSQEATY